MWKTSSRCDSNLCVRVWPAGDKVWVGDGTQEGARPVLSVTNADWTGFLGAIRSRELVKP